MLFDTLSLNRSVFPLSLCLSSVSLCQVMTERLTHPESPHVSSYSLTAHRPRAVTTVVLPPPAQFARADHTSPNQQATASDLTCCPEPVLLTGRHWPLTSGRRELNCSFCAVVVRLDRSSWRSDMGCRVMTSFLSLFPRCSH